MTSTVQEKAKLNLYGINSIAKQILAPPILAVMMFALAGTIEWLWGWVFTIVHIGVWTANTLALMRVNPELLNVRGRREQPGTKRWDWICCRFTALTGF